MNNKRQLSEKEKQQVLNKHECRCFVDGAPIAPDEPIEFHHIKPYSKKGPTHVDNIAPVCKRHHRTIGTMSLQQYRDKLRLTKFFDDDQPKYLDDLISHKRGTSGKRIPHEAKDSSVILYFDDTDHTYPLYTCPTTGWAYFYATLPVEHIRNDKSLQPRALRQNSLWNLYRHFQSNTQLAPSICRMDKQGTLLLFDGQHKAAAQIWAGHLTVECKVYLNPNERDLKETNLEAHGKYRQMSFYSHELMKKYADIFGEDWSDYMETEGEKSEQGFFKFLINSRDRTKSQARNEILLAMHNEIVDDPNNKLSAFLSEKNRSRKQPLTFARIKKTFLKYMLVPPPIPDEFESDTDFRKQEKLNLVRFLSIIAEEGLDGRWNPERDDAMHARTQRVFGAGSVRAWTILLRDTINTHLRHYTEDERLRFFYRHISQDDFEYFQDFVRKLFSHKIWDDPDPTGEIAARLAKDDATTTKSLFDEHGVTVHWLLGTPK